MKKKLYFITTMILSVTVLSLSSCLKDSRYIDFSKAGTIVDFPLGGIGNFGADAITETPGTDPNGTIVRQFAVNVASVNAPATATKITLAVDNTIITSYNALGGPVSYEIMPSDAFAFTETAVTIPAGQRYATVSVTFYKNKLDPSKSYMLPIKIANAGGLNISGNQGIHYYHFIGNDFAGAYEQFYKRWNTPDTLSGAANPILDLGTVIFNPVTPNNFTVTTGYYTAPRYDVSFTKTGTGASATYSNFTVRFLPADIAPGTTWATNITVVNQPVFLPPGYQTNPYDPNKQYSYAEALKLFRFYFTTASRSIMDQFVKQ